MTNTDSAPFQDIIPSISLRENERGAQIGPVGPAMAPADDLFSSLQRQDFPPRLNAAQTTLVARGGGELAGATLR